MQAMDIDYSCSSREYVAGMLELVGFEIKKSLKLNETGVCGFDYDDITVRLCFTLGV